MSVASLAIITAAPALAGPGGGHGGGGAMGNMGGGMGAQGMGQTMRDTGRLNSQGAAHANPRALERANENSVLNSAGTGNTATRIRGRSDLESTTGTRIPEGLDARSAPKSRAGARADVSVNAMGNVKLTGVTDGMTVVDSTGTTIGTVAGVTAKGNGSARIVQVTLNDGTMILLSARSLSLNDGVLTTNSMVSTANASNRRVNSQGPAHASIQGLTRASPKSVLAGAGVTTLTGLATGLTVENSGGTSIGTVDSIVTNRAGAVVGIRVDLTSGGTVLIPATTLSMDGTTVITSSTQF